MHQIGTVITMKPLPELLVELKERVACLDDERAMTIIRNGLPGRGVRTTIDGLFIPGFKGECIAICNQTTYFRIIPVGTCTYKSRPIWFEVNAHWRLDGMWDVGILAMRRTPESRAIPYTANARKDLQLGLHVALVSWAELKRRELYDVRDSFLRYEVMRLQQALHTALYPLIDSTESLAQAMAELHVTPDQRQLFHSLISTGIDPWGAVDACVALS